MGMHSDGNTESFLETGASSRALRAEHDAVDRMLDMLKDAVLSGAGGEVIFPILDRLAALAETHVIGERKLLVGGSGASTAAHAAAHRQLLERVRSARRLARGEDLVLATMDAVDILHDFNAHIECCSRFPHEQVMHV